MATDKMSSMELRRELDVGTKVSNLEKKASQLEKDFNDMLLTAREMEVAVKKYVKKAEAEHKSWEILEKLTERDANISDVLDHVKIFFNFVLAKMKIKRADVTDVKMLWHLIDCEGVSQCFNDVITACGFPRKDFENIRVMLSVVSKMQADLESEHGEEINMDELVNILDKTIQVETTLDTKFDYIGDTTEKSKPNADDTLKDSDELSGETLDFKVELIDKLKETTKLTDGKEFTNVNGSVHEVDMNNVGEAINKVKKLDNVKELGLPLREALKNVKFLDIDDDMKQLMRNIVCYVTKIIYE